MLFLFLFTSWTYELYTFYSNQIEGIQEADGMSQQGGL